MLTSRPALRVVRDPRPDTVVECPIATCLEVRFAAGVASRWRIEERPGHLVPLGAGGHSFTFMVFDGRREIRPLRLVRYRDASHGGGDVEERTLHVLPYARWAQAK